MTTQPTSFKNGTKVHATNKAGTRHGVVKATRAGAKGDFVDVEHVGGEVKSYRPSQLVNAK
jgi:hypothetical protein